MIGLMVKKNIELKLSKSRASTQALIANFGLFVIVFASSYTVATTIVYSNLYPDLYTGVIKYFSSLQTPFLLIITFLLGYFLLGKNKHEKQFAGVVMAFLAIAVLQTTDILRFSLGFFSSPTTFSFITSFNSELASFLFLLFTIVLISLIAFIFRRANVRAFSRRQMSVISLIIVFQSLLYPLNYIISGFFIMDFATRPLELIGFILLNPLSIVALIYLLLSRFNRPERLFYATLVCAMYTTLLFSSSFDGLALSLLSIIGILPLIALILLVYKLRSTVIKN